MCIRDRFYPRFYFDPTYIFIIIGVLICSVASVRVKSTFSRFSGMRNHLGLTGAQAAERVLHGAGIYDVRIERTSGHLTDHYDPRNKVLRLSDSTYGQCSVAAVGVAAHECGHATVSYTHLDVYKRQLQESVFCKYFQQ